MIHKNRQNTVIFQNGEFKGTYTFVVNNHLNSCVLCAFENRTECDDIKCMCNERIDNQSGYYIKEK